MKTELLPTTVGIKALTEKTSQETQLRLTKAREATEEKLAKRATA
ncbi:MAG TPA: hypothetical protein VGN10_06530 [Pyrinomonadaceae bacterium]|jgi:hypothetical protein